MKYDIFSGYVLQSGGSRVVHICEIWIAWCRYMILYSTFSCPAVPDVSQVISNIPIASMRFVFIENMIMKYGIEGLTSCRLHQLYWSEMMRWGCACRYGVVYFAFSTSVVVHFQGLVDIFLFCVILLIFFERMQDEL